MKVNSNLIFKIRYIRHPYLILRALTGYFERKYNKISRVSEYERFLFPVTEGLTKLLKCNSNLIESLNKELESKVEFLKIMNQYWEALKGFGGGMEIDDCRILYIICRVIRPKIVVETGTGHGFSSSFIIQALEDNGYGELYSIDLHYRNGISVPIGKQPGWVIPEYLKHRFHLFLGESTRIMPKLLRKLGKIDIFIHDSRHTYRTMIKEYETVLPYLRKDGLLLSHDVKVNDAFLDLCDRIRRTPVIIRNLGCVRL